MQVGLLLYPWQDAVRKFVRTTNFIERSFEEERCRTKTIARFFDEHSALKLVFGDLTRTPPGGIACT